MKHITHLYEQETSRLREAFYRFARGEEIHGHVSGFYPFVQVRVSSHARADNRRSYGFVGGPGVYRATITRPDLYARYLLDQFEQLIVNHGVPLEVGLSDWKIPIHFALGEHLHAEADLTRERLISLPDYFDLPDLAVMDDSIVNGVYEPLPGEPEPLSFFSAPRMDLSLHRLKHYTATAPRHFQNFVLFTNYQFYVDEFIRMGLDMMAEGVEGYSAFVEPGDLVTPNSRASEEQAGGRRPPRLPQMPAYHLKRPDGNGITMINIGVGPSNAKTITDHVAVIRPHCWIMLGHCAGLRTTQSLGDYVLAHGYVREDHVLDTDLPISVPLPPLAEVQLALEEACSAVTGLSGFELKRFVRTGTVATIDDRNWELRDQRGPVRRLSQSRAVALDMESATIAANGFRFRVPYGTLLCVSDKPLHGQMKLPGMADKFYRERVDQHLKIGLKTMEILREQWLDRLHSRKLRSFNEVAFR